MREKHPFGNFVPGKTKYLILGSFTGKRSGAEKASYDWFYSSKRNQFWPILEEVYKRELKEREQKQKLFIELGIAMADIIKSCERKKGSNLDTNLVNIIYNRKAVLKIIDENPVEQIFFSSRFVEIRFRRYFLKGDMARQIKLTTLPSPSPRNARLNKKEKILKYRELLPRR